eukprot:793145-Pleurochrysis_carterae.AAC.1
MNRQSIACFVAGGGSGIVRSDRTKFQSAIGVAGRGPAVLHMGNLYSELLRVSQFALLLSAKRFKSAPLHTSAKAPGCAE